MRTVARFIVRYRIAIASLFMVLAAICGLATLQVNVNRDMTQYLPANMQVKQGMNIMNEELAESTIVQIMVKNVPADQREQLADDLGSFNLVTSVTYEADSPFYNQGDYALFTASVKGNSFSDTAQRAADALEGALQARGLEYYISADIGNTANNLGPVYAGGIALALVILFTLASSWIEPLLMLITIVIAVLINMGTCIFLPSISDTTFSIAGILQMVLSMDYLIMLMNLYRTEREANDPERAMENALTRGVTTIASSSVTTVVGLLCLVAMSFTIGADLGIVLAKGVLLSLVCVFAVQPALTIAADRLISITAKSYPRPKMTGIATFAYKVRYPLLVVFLVLFAYGYGMRNVTQIDFVAPNNTAGTEVVRAVFPETQNVVVLYKNEDGDKASKLADELEKRPDLISVSSYESTIGKQKSAAEMADQMDMDTPLMNMLYYHRFHEGDVGALQASALADYLRGGIKDDLGDMLGDDMLESIDTLADLVADIPAGAYTPAELTAAIAKHSVTADTVKLLYLAYRGSHDADATWTMSLDELTAYLVDGVMKDQAFDAFFDAKTRATLQDARDQVVDGVAQIRGPRHSRLVVNAPWGCDAPEMDAFLNELRVRCDQLFGEEEGAYYLVGEGPMVQDMAASFSDEFSFISLITIAAILIIVLITFRSLAVPVVLVALIQCAFCWDMVLNYFLGNSIYYLALLVVQSILMGATIDYAILYTENYRYARKTMLPLPAAIDAYRSSVRTISMSGGILVVVTAVIGMFEHGLTGKICLIIGEGSFIAVLLVLFLLPGSIMALDKLIVPRAKRFEG